MLLIQPKISIKNLLFLVAYCWDPRDWSQKISLLQPIHDGSEIMCLLEAIALSFCSVLQRTVQKNVLQGYSTIHSSQSTYSFTRSACIESLYFIRHRARPSGFPSADEVRRRAHVTHVTTPFSSDLLLALVVISVARLLWSAYMMSLGACLLSLCVLFKCIFTLYESCMRNVYIYKNKG